MVARRFHRSQDLSRFRNGIESLEARLMLTVELVADIFPGGGSSSPTWLRPFGDGVAFTAHDPGHGRELWFASGSQTERVDIQPGANGSSPTLLTPAEQNLFFVADDGTRGRELWVSKGTAQETFMVKDIRPNADSTITEMVAVGHKVFFLVGEGDTKVLWTSDGTSVGTHPVVFSDETPKNLKIRRLRAATDLVYFLGDDGETGVQLWRSDGSTAGTIQLTATDSARRIKRLLTVGNTAYFSHGPFVGQSFGTVTDTIDNVFQVDEHFVITHMSEAHGKLAFRSCSLFNANECYWREVDPADGSVNMAHVLASFGARPETQFMLQDRQNGNFMTNVRDWDESDGFYYVAGSRVTSRGIRGRVPGIVEPLRLDSTPSPGIWRTDLTVNGTRLIADVDSVSDLGDIAVAEDGVYIALQREADTGQELYRFDRAHETQSVAFSAPTYQIGESGDTIGPTIEVVRSHAVGRQSIGVQVYPETAQETDDIVAFAGNDLIDQRFVVDFANGESSKTIAVASAFAAEIDEFNRSFGNADFVHTTDPNAIVTLRNDALYEHRETFQLRIWPISSSLAAGEGATTTVTVVDDDPRRIVVTPTEFGTKVVVGGSADHFDVSLSFAPLGPVVVEPIFDANTIDVHPTQLTFSPENWNTPQQFQITGHRGSAETQLTVAVDRAASDQTAQEVDRATVSFAVEEPVPFQLREPGVWLANLNDESRGLSPQRLAPVGDYLFFAGDDGIHGRELWRTDGTADGTILLADSVPGEVGAFKEELPRQAYELSRSASIGNVLYYFVEGDESALWRSDGQPDGTWLVKELPATPGEIVAVGDQLIFAVQRTLWVSDGTAAGTNVIPPGEIGYPRELTTVGDLVFFQAPTLWVTDGSEEGTRRLTNESAEELAAVGDTLFFAGGRWRRGSGEELWKSDGTEAGTVLVRDISPGVSGSDPQDLQDIDGLLHFRANGDAWTSDGTRKGTRKVGERGGIFFKFRNELYVAVNGIYRVEKDLPVLRGLSLVRNVMVTDEAFFFTARREGSNVNEFWRSDGTNQGTKPVMAIGDDPVLHLSSAPVVDWEGEFYFAASDETGGIELWATDGARDGTRIILDHQKGEGSSIDQLINVAGRLYFTADDAVTPAAQVWVADPDQAALLVATNERPSSRGHEVIPGGIINFFETFNNEFVFTHTFHYRWSSTVFDLWKSDGTGAGTELIAPLYYSYFGEDDFDLGPMYHAVHDGKLYFERGRYDGEQISTLPEIDFEEPAQFTSVGDKLFFSAKTREHGTELWVTTDDFGTSQQLTFRSPARDDGILREHFTPEKSEFVEFQEHLLFTAGIEFVSRPAWIRDVRELWISDGTRAGTRSIFDPDHGHLENLLVADDRLFFSSSDPPALWMLSDIESPAQKIKQFAAVGEDFLWSNGRLWFAADDGNGLELWSSDGTPDGTRQVADVSPGSRSSRPSSFAVVGDRLYFTAHDDLHGREVWSSDGTEQGTRLFYDIFPGRASSDPTQLAAIDDRLFLVADDGRYGSELWQFDTRAVDSILGDINGDDVVNFDDFFILSANYGQPTSAGVPDGDLDGNGRVDFNDFVVLSTNFGNQRPRP